MTRVLVAGMGNVLRGDDGFGVEVARKLAEPGAMSPGITLVEVGIGGIHLVQELMAGYDALIVIDAAERGSAPGTIHVLEAEVPDLALWPEDKRGDFLADMHYTTPTKALVLAKALKILPSSVFIVGCQPSTECELGIGLTEPVERAVSRATAEVEALATKLMKETFVMQSIRVPVPGEEDRAVADRMDVGD